MATSRRIEGPTPHGGAYAIVLFSDDHGESVDESVATRAVAREYDEDGNDLGSAYYRITHENDDGDGDE